MCAHTRASDLLTYSANGSDQVELQDQLFLGLNEARLECSSAPLHPSAASCFIRYSCCPISSLTSPALAAWCPNVAKYEGWGPRCVPCVSPPPSATGVPALGWWGDFLPLWGQKGPSVFSLVDDYAPYTRRSNTHVRKTAVMVQKLSPKPVPTNETVLSLYLSNLVLHPS